MYISMNTTMAGQDTTSDGVLPLIGKLYTRVYYASS